MSFETPKFPETEAGFKTIEEQDLETARDKALSAGGAAEAKIGSSWETIGQAYYKFELAQGRFKAADKTFKEWNKENWESEYDRAAKVKEWSWVGEKIRTWIKDPDGYKNEWAKIADKAEKRGFDHKKANLIGRAESSDKYEKNNPKEINFKSVADMSETDLEKVRVLLKNSLGIAVHGEKIRIKKGEGAKFLGQTYMRPDFDARMAAYLFSHATENEIGSVVTRSVGKGKYIKGAVNCDTGERPDGITINEKDGTIFIDHHGEERGAATSAAKIAYELLDRLGLLRLQTANGTEIPKEIIKKMVDFGVENDNLNYPIDEKVYKETWWQTIYAGKVYELLPIDKVIEFFVERNDPRVPLPEKYRDIEVRTMDRDSEGNAISTVKKIGDILKEEEKNIPKAQKGIEQNEWDMRKARTEKQEFAGRVFDNRTPELGKFLVNLMPINPESATNYYMRIPPTHALIAARALGQYDTVISWNMLNKSLKVESDRDLNPLFQRLRPILPGIKSIRGAMIIDTLGDDYKKSQARAEDYEKRTGKKLDMDTILEAIFSYREPSPSDKDKTPPVPQPAPLLTSPAPPEDAEKRATRIAELVKNIEDKFNAYQKSKSDGKKVSQENYGAGNDESFARDALKVLRDKGYLCKFILQPNEKDNGFAIKIDAARASKPNPEPKPAPALSAEEIEEIRKHVAIKTNDGLNNPHARLHAKIAKKWKDYDREDAEVRREGQARLEKIKNEPITLTPQAPGEVGLKASEKHQGSDESQPPAPPLELPTPSESAEKRAAKIAELVKNIEDKFNAYQKAKSDGKKVSRENYGAGNDESVAREALKSLREKGYLCALAPQPGNKENSFAIKIDGARGKS